MTLTPVTAIRQVPPCPPYRTPAYALTLACGHTVTHSWQEGPIPKRVRCRECGQ